MKGALVSSTVALRQLTVIPDDSTRGDKLPLTESEQASMKAEIKTRLFMVEAVRIYSLLRL
jgi:hypothetical protein